MQTGFAMLEVGTVNKKNTSNILLKNVLDASVGSIVWMITGFGLAIGDASGSGGFMGSTHMGLNEDEFGGEGYMYGMWLFQWAFAATTATIVSGAVAERCTFTAYITYSVCLTGFVYPVVVCWGWNTQGWASAWKSVDDDANPLLFGCGVIDFAGSGVVHMTGGVAALVGSAFLKPRKARQPVTGGPLLTLPSDYAPEYGPIFQTLGTLILWMGWYGFNGVSTLYIVNYGLVAAKTMVTTTLSAGTGAVTTLFIGSLMQGKVDGAYVLKLGDANNGVLAGLVAITAPCSTCEPYGAFIIGFGAAFVYLGSNALLTACKIDDVVSAIPVHGFCGFYGVIMASLFATKDNYAAAYYSDRAKDCAGVLYGGDGSSLAAAICFLLAVIVWVAALSCVVFGALSGMGMLRVDPTVEDDGMDKSEHGVTGGYAAAATTAGGAEMVEKDAGSNL
mmetsp:Transcript_75966/g.216768  ORF Transcript_75966/g.216768 Transcript_75966/m.216768 type:complete len:447 (-) Transcript_75966:186-1526(-)